MKWRELLACAAIVLIVGALLFPVFSQAKYSGPGLNNDRIARTLAQVHQDTGQWTASFESLRPYLGYFPPHEHRVAILKIGADANGAEYAIEVNGVLERWRIENDGKFPKRLSPAGSWGKLVYSGARRS